MLKLPRYVFLPYNTCLYTDRLQKGLQNPEVEKTGKKTKEKRKRKRGLQSLGLNKQKKRGGKKKEKEKREIKKKTRDRCKLQQHRL
jgi:hypothetical protein